MLTSTFLGLQHQGKDMRENQKDFPPDFDVLAYVQYSGQGVVL